MRPNKGQRSSSTPESSLNGVDTNEPDPALQRLPLDDVGEHVIHAHKGHEATVTCRICQAARSLAPGPFDGAVPQRVGLVDAAVGGRGELPVGDVVPVGGSTVRRAARRSVDDWCAVRQQQG